MNTREGWSCMLEYLGYAAGVLTVVSFLPQVVRAWRTRKVEDLSFGMFALLTRGAARRREASGTRHD